MLEDLNNPGWQKAHVESESRHGTGWAKWFILCSVNDT